MHPSSIKKLPIPLVTLFVMVGILCWIYPTFNVVKSVHVVAIISWFAGLFYLPRLFVYHAEATEKSVADTLSIMEWKLFYYIMNPAAVISLFSGGMMLHLWQWNLPEWMHIKLTLVALLLLFHCYCWRLVDLFWKGENKRTGKFYRILNEVPTIILIGIVYLVVFQPHK